MGNIDNMTIVVTNRLGHYIGDEPSTVIESHIIVDGKVIKKTIFMTNSIVDIKINNEEVMDDYCKITGIDK